MIKRFIESVVASALEVSRPIQALALGVKELAEQVVVLASALQKVVDQQIIHDKVIAKLWNAHQELLDALSKKTVDGRMLSRRDDTDNGSKSN